MLNGSNGDDTINGGAGNDTITAGAASAVPADDNLNALNGGAGLNIYNVTNSTDTITDPPVSALAVERDTVNLGGTSGTLTVGNNIEIINLLGFAAANLGVTLSREQPWPPPVRAMLEQ
ncbi:MAG: hypothetical protein IPN42_19235 [Methylococcaceae bacterium]|nr:hypothetical protein [Methylococcaceae bacterium]